MPNPASIARARTAWRARTTSSEVRTAIVSFFSTTKHAPLVIDRPTDQGEAFVDVEGRAHASQRQPELNEGNGDCGPHADHDGDRIEHPRHRGNVAEHAADEGIDDLER